MRWTPITILELNRSGEHKFYTIIDRQDGSMDCNYGPDEPGSWFHTKNYPIGREWEKRTARTNHGYMIVKESKIDLDFLGECEHKLSTLSDLASKLADRMNKEYVNAIHEMWRELRKHGMLSPKSMKLANQIYLYYYNDKGE